MARKRTAPMPQKPTTAAAAAPLLRKAAVKLFDRPDGHAADWPLIAETLLLEAFYALDQSPEDPRSKALVQQVHSCAYSRMVGNASESLVTDGGIGAGRSFNASAMELNHDADLGGFGPKGI